MQFYKLLGIIIFGVSAVVGITSCNNARATQPSKSDEAGAQPAALTKQARFKVEGMTCASCNVTVKVAAEKVDGVSKAGASHEKKSAWAVYDPAKTNPKAIAEAITAAGYPATVSK